MVSYIFSVISFCAIFQILSSAFFLTANIKMPKNGQSIRGTLGQMFYSTFCVPVSKSLKKCRSIFDTAPTATLTEIGNKYPDIQYPSKNNVHIQVSIVFSGRKQTNMRYVRMISLDSPARCVYTTERRVSGKHEEGAQAERCCCILVNSRDRQTTDGTKNNRKVKGPTRKRVRHEAR